MKIYKNGDFGLNETVDKYLEKDVVFIYLTSKNYKEFVNSKLHSLKNIFLSSASKEQQFDNLKKVTRFIQDELIAIGFDQELLNEADGLIDTCINELSDVQEIKKYIELFLTNEGHLCSHSTLLVYLIKSTFSQIKDVQAPKIQHFVIQLFCMMLGLKMMSSLRFLPHMTLGFQC